MCVIYELILDPKVLLPGSSYILRAVNGMPCKKDKCGSRKSVGLILLPVGIQPVPVCPTL